MDKISADIAHRGSLYRRGTARCAISAEILSLYRAWA